MGIGGGSSRKGLYGTPDSGSMANMPSTRSMNGMPDTNRLNGMPDTRRMNGTPDTRSMVSPRSGTEFERYAERQERNERKGMKDLLEEKRKERLKDPQEARKEGMVRLSQDDSYPDFIKGKCKRDGSVIVCQDGICLSGEDRRMALGGEDTYVYSMKNGIREWRKAGTMGASGGEEGVQEAIAGSSGMFAWDSKSKTMKAGGCMVGRTWVNASGVGEKPDGTYWLKVTFDANGDVTATVVNAGGTRTDTECYIPIYTVSGGKVTNDLRGAFVVPCWE